MNPDEKPKLKIDEDDLLHLVLEEHRQAVGYENGTELNAQRQLALEYIKGEMRDAPAQNNRSKAMSSDVSDAIETALPDLIDIFMSEDVATFKPRNEQDENQADQETDYIRYVVMEENDGFLLLYTAFKDALSSKTGVFKWWWEAYDNSGEEHFEGKDPQELLLAMQDAQLNPSIEIADVEQVQSPTGPTVNFTVRTNDKGGRVCVQAVNPDDFSVARDTVNLKDATYCCMRTRVRAQSLIKQGYDRDLVEELPNYGAPSYTDQVELARDTVNEQTMTPNVGTDGLRMVEIVEHFLRHVGDDGEETIYRVVTGGDGEQGVVLEAEVADHIQFSAITPYPQTHRFYGRSLADLLLEIQKIKTALLRMFLDSGYFALNQRYEVAESGQNDFTYSDLIRNEPGVPVRSKTGEAVRPITAGGLNFDVPAAMEYVSTVAEARTGIVRNAQGLNPDTLHDTATGAQQLIAAAQKRLRMIARIFAETGLRDMFLGVHAMLRTHAEKASVFKLRGKWDAIDPTQWAERTSMSIEIGVGSGGRAQELAAMNAIMGVTEKLVQAQGSLNGPIVTLDNIYNQASRMVTRGLGMKSAEPFFTDPKQAAAQQAGQPQQPPPPDPEMVKAQMEHQRAQQEAEADQQQAQAKLQADQQAQQAKIAADMQLGQMKLQQDAESNKARLEAEMALERYKADQNLQLQREQIAADTHVEMQKAQMQAQASIITAKRPDMGDDYVSREPGGDIGNIPSDL